MNLILLAIEFSLMFLGTESVRLLFIFHGKEYRHHCIPSFSSSLLYTFYYDLLLLRVRPIVL